VNGLLDSGTLVYDWAAIQVVECASFPVVDTGHGPQGDAIRIYNYVRMVRDMGGRLGNSEIGEQFGVSMF
jgi:hypothetical protein